jgi:hypothetical protein
MSTSEVIWAFVAFQDSGKSSRHYLLPHSEFAALCFLFRTSSAVVFRAFYFSEGNMIWMVFAVIVASSPTCETRVRAARDLGIKFWEWNEEKKSAEEANE